MSAPLLAPAGPPAAAAPVGDASRETVAILPWGLLYEDFLDSIGVSLEAFCGEMTGGYLFNFVDALATQGIRSVVVLVTARVTRPTRLVHRGTGATVLAVPPPRAYLALRGVLRAGPVRRGLGRARPLRALLEEVAAYVSTPSGALAAELRREGCGAVLCQEYEYARFDSLVLPGPRLGLPVFATFQGADRTWGFLQRAVRPLALRRAAGLVVGPRLEAERVRARYGVPDDAVARIFNPVDADAFGSVPRAEARAALEIPDGARVVAWYGRVEREVKGLDVLLDAWARVCRERPDADLRLLLVGTGSDAAWLRGRLADPALRGVRWRDEYVHDRRVLRLHLSAADVFAFPSRREGFPVAPMEAMACGVPVVGADAPGVPDILEGGEASGGIVVPRGDPAAFALALGRVLDDPTLARRLGARARERAEACFSLEAVGTQLAAFLRARGLRAAEGARG